MGLPDVRPGKDDRVTASSPQPALGRLSVPSVPASVASIRRFAAEACAGQGLGEIGEVVRLLVSEVATNALVHGSGEVVVRVLPTTVGLRVEVADESPVLPRRRTAGLDAEGGRGLGLVDALSVAWGSRREGAGKVVWFEVARDAA